MNYCCIFSRVSTLVQDIEQQTNYLIEEAIRLGYDKEHQIIIQIKESAISLDISTRKGIKELKEKIEKNKNIDCVICYELSRIARRADVIYNIRDFLIEHKIRWIVYKPYMELINENGELSQISSLMLGIFTSFAETEMKISKERMMRGKKAKMLKNIYVSGFLLLGYKLNSKNEIDINYEEAEIVRKIFKWYSEGKSMIWIGREMIERGYCKDRWNGINSYVCSLKHVLRRVEYTGKQVKSYVYPRIISDELFEAVQKRITKNKAKFITKRQYLGQGLVREKDSGLLMSPNEHHYRVYRIGKSDRITINTRCLENLIWEICEKRAKTISKEKAQKIYIHDQNVINNKIKTIKEEIEYNKSRIDKINARIVNGKMDEAKGDTMISEINDEIEILEKAHNEYIDKLVNLKPNEVDLNDRKSIVRNEIEAIYISKLEGNANTTKKLIEINFTDGTMKKYTYYSKSRSCWVE